MLKRRVNEDAPSRSGAGLARLLVVCVGVFSCGCLSQRHVAFGSRMAAIQLSGCLCRFSWIPQRMVPILCCLHAASECFGVAGMIESTASQGLRYLLRKEDTQDKGVKVRYGANGLVIDLHIAVTYGVNISAIVKSIVNKVRYTVEEATGFQVAKVNVFVDDMKQ